MTQQERLIFLIKYLILESSEYKNIEIPNSEIEQKKLLRSLMNVRLPKPISREFLEIQNRYLEEENKKHLVSLSELKPIRKGIYLWKGDITTLQIDGIVNAANSAMLGCFVPCHGCIDNAIHTYAGIELRLECAELMRNQIEEEPTGSAKITGAYNLPSKYVIHTVGPIIHKDLKLQDCELLASCYRSCIDLAIEHDLKSLAFCCISTGEFHFPNDKAAEIAVTTVMNDLKRRQSEMEVVFNVYKEIDYKLYQRLLEEDREY
ncbi:MAG TPA: protein-ADP-ribose hydrolase [Candidatus Merdenecus merdavium]|nr:protein-ADP-ribose hydrolase [Candidatus Merdenecus merdavium]